MRTAFKCRACPDIAQAAILTRTFGCIRVVWNKTLHERGGRWRAHGQRTSYRETDAALTEWKKTEDLAFLAEVSSVPLQQVLRHQHAAFANFFAGRARYPRSKNRNSRQSAHYTRAAFSMKAGKLHLAKTTAPLEYVWSWPEIDQASLDPSTVSVAREPDGRWFVTFAIDTGAPVPLRVTERVVGVDLGIKDFAVTSDGEKIANPRNLERKAKNLTRYQRRTARCENGSRNRARAAKAKLARAHRKVRNARQDFLHKVSARLVRENDVIAIEDLNVSGMVENRGLARSISNAGWGELRWGELRRQLTYKCERAGRRLVVVGRWYPSSKTCSMCGHLLTQLSLGTKHWTCPACRTRHDRDVNAAKNILAAGLAVARSDAGDACGADVRRQGSSLPRSAVNQEPSRPLRTRAAAQPRD